MISAILLHWFVDTQTTSEMINHDIEMRQSNWVMFHWDAGRVAGTLPASLRR